MKKLNLFSLILVIILATSCDKYVITPPDFPTDVVDNPIKSTDTSLPKFVLPPGFFIPKVVIRKNSSNNTTTNSTTTKDTKGNVLPDNEDTRDIRKAFKRMLPTGPRVAKY